MIEDSGLKGSWSEFEEVGTESLTRAKEMLLMRVHYNCNGDQHLWKRQYHDKEEQ